MTLSDRIKRLIEILREEDLDEIEVRNWFSGIRIARRRGASSAVELAQDVRNEHEPESVPVEETVEPVPVEAEAPTGDEGLEEITSPMVGTFYRSAGPELDPLASVGTRVETGQVICIIEAMKLMNEIEAEHAGIIRKILVEDSQPVEFGQPLFLVESA